MKTIIFIANNNIGQGQSGGDTIFLEFIKNWQDKLNITVFGSQESLNLLRRYKINTNIILTDGINPRSEPTVTNLLYHTCRRLWFGTKKFIINYKLFTQAEYCYTISDFLPDLFFGLLYKIINPKGIWLCGQYLFAPKPNDKNSPYHQQKLKGSLYYLFQLITQLIANKFTDQILITSEPDRYRFPHKKIIVVQGGVDITESEKYLKSNKIKPLSQRKFDAVFQGRLHLQKGVIELIDIWRLVVNKHPLAKLAVIGDGQLENVIKEKIKKNKLTNHVTIFGFQSGLAKYRIFTDSKIVVHPAIYDSGGMAAAEAMAWGLPGVSFDLEALKTYYPKGMLKTPVGDQKIFADNIIKLTSNEKIYQQVSQDALELIRSVWDWKKRSQKIYQQIFND